MQQNFLKQSQLKKTTAMLSKLWTYLWDGKLKLC